MCMRDSLQIQRQNGLKVQEWKKYSMRRVTKRQPERLYPHEAKGAVLPAMTIREIQAPDNRAPKWSRN